MAVTKREPVLVEITEEAYKQNSVYRPWDETRVDGVPESSRTSPTPHQALQILAAGTQQLAAAGIPR